MNIPHFERITREKHFLKKIKVAQNIFCARGYEVKKCVKSYNCTPFL